MFLEWAVQRMLGDPAPAITVAASYGMTPENVRQTITRMRRRVEVAAPHLAALPLVS